MESSEPMTIYAIGRNYLDHIQELKNERPEQPLIFIKAGSTLARPGAVTLPAFSKDVHYEGEMALQLGKDLKPKACAISLDLTARDIQTKLKSKGEPWALAKSFTHSCPIGNWFPIESKSATFLLELQLTVLLNGQLKQNASTQLMLFKPIEIIDYLRERFPIQENDIVLTGTPAGVGPVKSGDVIEAKLTDKDKNLLSSGTWDFKS